MNTSATNQQRSLFLGDLSIYCTEMNIQALFVGYGPIESIIVKKGYSNQNQSKYGFITFRFVESALRALKDLQGAIVLGRPIRLDLGSRREKRVNVCRTAHIQFSFISHQTHIVISEASLRDLFSEFGEVIDVMIKKSEFDEGQRRQHGYGFIHYAMTFEGVYSALKAVHAIHQVAVGVVTYDTTLSTSLRALIEQDPDLWKIWEGIQRGSLNENFPMRGFSVGDSPIAYSRTSQGPLRAHSHSAERQFPGTVTQTVHRQPNPLILSGNGADTNFCEPKPYLSSYSSSFPSEQLRWLSSSSSSVSRPSDSSESSTSFTSSFFSTFSERSK